MSIKNWFNRKAVAALVIHPQDRVIANHYGVLPADWARMQNHDRVALRDSFYRSAGLS